MLDNDLKPVSENQMGEIFSSGLNVAKGYVGVKDSEKFLPNHLSQVDGKIHKVLNIYSIEIPKCS